ncbi:hypothetical protein Pmani_006218 [Petrolisthes manimaculis]|uniref:Tc1-like transposase DDE domain-containing protein n=1 Tax=Petrolisthes manimaculis TaxID=1843537 RepID=A0AAE1QA79_9EUCA|nr:hypothetical protein Pmani_006218 [Petrolisthes manimaculis]
MWEGLGDLTRIEGYLNAQKYINILENILLSIRATAIPAPNPIRFVHDRSPIHTSRIVTEWLAQHQEREVIDWPSKGCVMNPTENVWGMMVRTWDIRDERTREAIEQHARQEWDIMKRNPTYCRRLVEPMPDRLAAVVTSDAGWSKY